nr:hypothetical protein [Betaproteobacteria bacterium]
MVAKKSRRGAKTSRHPAPRKRHDGGPQKWLVPMLEETYAELHPKADDDDVPPAERRTLARQLAKRAEAARERGGALP